MAGKIVFFTRWEDVLKKKKMKTFFFKTKNFRSSHCGAMETNPTRNHEVEGSISGLAQWVKDPALP